MPQLHPPRQHKHRDRSDRQATDNVRREHHAAPLEAVAHGAADKQRRNVRHRPGDADEGERARIIGEPVHLPRDRHEIDAVAEEGNLRSHPEKNEISRAEWPHDAHGGREAYERNELSAFLRFTRLISPVLNRGEMGPQSPLDCCAS